MQFLLIEKPSNIIHVGPKEYHKNYFKSSLEDDLEITDFTLPQTLSEKLTITDKAEIIPCTLTYPNYNPKTEVLSGPFWDYSDANLALGSFEVLPKPVHLLQSELKQRVADNRWRKENAGVKVTIQNTEVSVSTVRGERDLFLQALQLGADGKNWKFPEGFFVLSLSDLQTIVTAIVNHVQSCFDWEHGKVTEIMNSEDLSVLDAIDVGDEQPRGLVNG